MMVAVAAASIGQYEKSVRALADYYRTVQLGLGACLRKSGSAPLIAERKRQTVAAAIGAVVFSSDQGLVGQFRFLRILRTGMSCNEVDNQVFLFDVSYFHRGGAPSCPRVSCTMVSGCMATAPKHQI